MDRTQPCGGCDVGSIPTGSTKDTNIPPARDFVLCAGRSDVPQACGTARRGRGKVERRRDFIRDHNSADRSDVAPAIELSVTTKDIKVKTTRRSFLLCRSSKPFRDAGFHARGGVLLDSAIL